jgi:hypothetical protein
VERPSFPDREIDYPPTARLPSSSPLRERAPRYNHRA